MFNFALVIVIVFGLKAIDAKDVKLNIVFLIATFAISNIFMGYFCFNSIIGSMVFFVFGYFIIVGLLKVSGGNEDCLYYIFLIANILAILVVLNDLFKFIPKVFPLILIGDHPFVSTVICLSFAYSFAYFKKTYNFYIEKEESVLKDDYTKSLKFVQKQSNLKEGISENAINLKTNYNTTE
jgi:hypothetical protein